MPPRLARLLAAVVAIALVAGAFALRGALADDDDTTGPEAAGDDGDPPDGEAYRLLCDADLGDDVCAAVEEATDAEVEVVAAGQMLDQAEEPPPADAWLTLDPMPAILDAGRGPAGPSLTTGEPVAVASSTLALLAVEEAPGGCADEPAVDWSCLADPPVPPEPEVAIPAADTALGLLAVAAGATGLEGTRDFGRGAYQGTANADLLGELVDDSPSQAGTTTAEQTESMFNPGTASAAVTVEGLANRRAGTIRGSDRGLRVVLLDPAVTVGVVLAGVGPRGEEAVRALEEAVTGQTVADALSDAGWDGGAERTNGLPAPDVILGLREELG